MNYRSSNSSLWPLLIAFVLIFGASCLPHCSRGTVTAKVTDKERINQQDTGYYLVYTDREVFRNSDAWIEGKFNSSDVQGALRTDRCYRFEVYGWRVPMFSFYRNIVDYTPVNCPEDL